MLRVICMDFVSLLDISQYDLEKDSEILKSSLLKLARKAVETDIPITVVFSKEPKKEVRDGQNQNDKG